MIKISIYQPNFLSFNNLTIDAGQSQNFTATCQGSYADFSQLIIRDMSNNIKYNTSATPLTQTLYQNDTFSYSLPSSTLNNGNEFTWQLSLWSDSLPINQCFSYNASGAGTYTDETTAANNSTVNDLHLVPIGTVQDAYYFGSSALFSGINLTVGTNGVYSATLVYEYYSSTSSSWIAIPLLTDNTSGFTKSGAILFQPPSDWATTAVNSSTKYWIRCRVSTFTSKTTSPLGTQAWMKNSATSRQTPFFCYSVPTVSMTTPSTITSMSNIFTAVYSQSQGIALNYWYMVISDNLGNLILQTPNSYSGNISYTYSGFISGNSYQIYTVVVNQQGVTTQSITYSFTVSYSKPSLNIVPTTTVLSDLSAVQINWSVPIQINGSIFGTSSYYNSLFNPNNTGLNLLTGTAPSWMNTNTVDSTKQLDSTKTYDSTLDASILLQDILGATNLISYVEFDLTIPIGFTAIVDYIPDPTFTSGVIMELDDANGLYYQVGYDGTKFYYNNNGVTINGTPKTLPSSVFRIAIKGIEVLIIYNNQIYDDLHP